MTMMTTLALIAVTGFVLQLVRLRRSVLDLVGAGPHAGPPADPRRHASTVAELYARFDLRETPPPSRLPADTPVRRIPGPARHDDAAPVRTRPEHRQPDAAPGPPRGGREGEGGCRQARWRRSA